MPIKITPVQDAVEPIIYLVLDLDLPTAAERWRRPASYNGTRGRGVLDDEGGEEDKLRVLPS